MFSVHLNTQTPFSHTLTFKCVFVTNPVATTPKWKQRRRKQLHFWENVMYRALSAHDDLIQSYINKITLENSLFFHCSITKYETPHVLIMPIVESLIYFHFSSGLLSSVVDSLQRQSQLYRKELCYRCNSIANCNS